MTPERAAELAEWREKATAALPSISGTKHYDWRGSGVCGFCSERWPCSPVRDFQEFTTAPRVLALLDEVERLREAARNYLLHDGSGNGRTDEWRGDFDAMALADARDRLRAALSRE